MEVTLKFKNNGSFNKSSLNVLKKLNKTASTSHRISKIDLMKQVFFVSDNKQCSLNQYKILENILKYLSSLIVTQTKKYEISPRIVKTYLQYFNEAMSNKSINDIVKYFKDVKQKVLDYLLKKKKTIAISTINLLYKGFELYIKSSFGIFQKIVNVDIVSTYIFCEVDDDVIVYKYIYAESKLVSSSLDEFIGDESQYNAIIINNNSNTVPPDRVYKLKYLIPQEIMNAPNNNVQNNNVQKNRQNKQLNNNPYKKYNKLFNTSENASIPLLIKFIMIYLEMDGSNKQRTNDCLNVINEIINELSKPELNQLLIDLLKLYLEMNVTMNNGSINPNKPKILIIIKMIIKKLNEDQYLNMSNNNKKYIESLIGNIGSLSLEALSNNNLQNTIKLLENLLKIPKQVSRRITSSEEPQKFSIKRFFTQKKSKPNRLISTQ